MDNQDVKKFREKAGEMAGDLLAAIVYSRFSSRLEEFISEPIARATKVQGEAEAATAAAKNQLMQIEATILRKKEEAGKLSQELQELNAEKERRASEISNLAAEELKLQRRLEALRHSIATEARA
jgi:chromosome segregation ATPase